MRDRAVDTYTILDSDVVKEGGQRTENKELRRKHGDDVCMPTAEAPLAKKKKKNKHCGISEVDVENAPTYSSTPGKLTTMNFNEFPTMPFGEGNSMEIASGPVPQTSTANEKNTTTFEFMIRHTKKNSLAIKEIGERLKLIVEKLPNRTVNERNTCDNVFNPTDLGLPVTTEEGLSNLDSKLQDLSTFINMLVCLTVKMWINYREVQYTLHAAKASIGAQI